MVWRMDLYNLIIRGVGMGCLDCMKKTFLLRLVFEDAEMHQMGDISIRFDYCSCRRFLFNTF